MTTDLLAAPFAPQVEAGQPVRLAVSWQHPTTRSHQPVGLLECSEDGYTFRYLRRARAVPGFQPFLGFDDLAATYRSPWLFPLFSQRVMSPNRADYPRYLDALWLPEPATDWQILDRSQGQREGDGVRLVLEPPVKADGTTSACFFVNGIRHRLAHDPTLEGVLGQLEPGDRLQLRSEPDNPVNARAVLVAEQSGAALGYVPDLLLDWVSAVRAEGDPEVIVVHVNGPRVPPGFRLLVRVAGQVRPGFGAFAGPSWV